MKPGATGRFPSGKIHPSDKGELQIAIGNDKAGNVVIDFGNNPIKWIAMDIPQAIQFAMGILKSAGFTTSKLEPLQ